MDYIINPAWFYLISIANGLKILFVSAAIIVGIIAIVGLCYGYTEDEEEAKKLGKKMTIIFVITVTIAIFIPSEEAIYQMLIASLATKGNIQEIVQAILDAAKQLTGK